MAQYRIYPEQLLCLGYGYALYDPDPAGRYDEVRIGDVGYVERGTFHKLFNITYPSDHEHNECGVPEGFEPLTLPVRHEYKTTRLPEGVRCTGTIALQGGDCGITLGQGCPVQAGARIHMSCSEKLGAVLITSHPSYRLDTNCILAFKSYMLKNYRSWVQFARTTLYQDVRVEDIILVTGRDLTKQWATAAFVEKARDAGVSFHVEDGFGSTFGQSGLSFWGSWRSSNYVPNLRGPEAVTPLEDGGLAQPRIECRDSQTDPLSTPSGYNQCVFIRGFRVRERRFRLPKVIKAAAEGGGGGEDPEDGSPPPSTSFTPMVLDDSMNWSTESVQIETIQDISGRDSKAEPQAYDVIARCIFENSDVDVAILHDNEVCELFKRNTIKTLEDLNETLHEGMKISADVKVEVIDGVKVGSWEPFLEESASMSHHPSELGEVNVDVNKEAVGALVDCGFKLEQSHLDDEQSRAVTPREGSSGQSMPTHRDSQLRPFGHESGVKVKDMVSVGDDASVKRTREQSVNETFIVVRPPPSASNHPLNLQIQLIPPQFVGTPVDSWRSVDIESSHDTASVSSSNASFTTYASSISIRSNRSDISSFYSSSSSMTTVSSFASATSLKGTRPSSRRMIIPLYNLKARNVLTNTVVDAGTDAKVAKLTKRGMEINGLAILGVIEVWNGQGGRGETTENLVEPSQIESMEVDVAQTYEPVDSRMPKFPVLPLSSINSQIQAVLGPSSDSMPALPTSTPPNEPSSTYTQSGAKRLFSRIFKRRDSVAKLGQHTRQSSASLEVTERAGSSMPELPTLPTTGPTTEMRQASSGSNTTPNLAARVQNTLPEPFLRSPCLGIQATVACTTYPPSGKPIRYVWVVRKWLKKPEGGSISGINTGFNSMKGMRGLRVNERSGDAGDEYVADEPGKGVEVRLEWVKNSSKRAHSSKIPAQLSKAPAGRWGSTQTTPESPIGHLFESNQTSELQLHATRRDASSLKCAPSPFADSEAQGESRSEHKSGVPAAAVNTDMQAQTTEQNYGSVAKIDASDEDERGGFGPASARTSDWEEKGASMFRTALGTPQRLREEDGEESGSENMETPWTCYLTVHSIRGQGREEREMERERERELIVTSLSKMRSMGSQAQTPPLSAHPSGSSTATESTIHSPPHSSHKHHLPPRVSTSHSSISNAPSHLPPLPLLKLKIAVLSSTPHHPKVVAQLKVPFPLPDIEVDRAKTRKRVIVQYGNPNSHEPSNQLESSAEDTRGGRNNNESGDMRQTKPYEGLVLTAEEIKDMLFSTAFWFIVREGVGGVGKDDQKRERWAIRE